MLPRPTNGATMLTIMSMHPVRREAVAGSWYPGRPAVLAAEVDRYLSAVSDTPPAESVVGLVAPHAGLMYSGPVAAWAYRAVQGGAFDVVVLVGPSHRVGFDGVAVYPRGAFDTPLGPMAIAEDVADAILAATPVVREDVAAHRPEHSLEMQLPFLRRVLPEATIVPLLMGYQSEATIQALGDALSAALVGRRVLLVASSDLSHYLDARAAAAADREVLDCVERFDPEGLMAALRAKPDHACGGGPIVSVMRAARALGARSGRVLRYADSGDVSGDKTAVVGYMAAAFVA
jgi:AmmeMemoRadiSam system protein B